MFFGTIGWCRQFGNRFTDLTGTGRGWRLTNANVAKQPEGRADEAILEMKELGGNVFYGE